jgi:hypothetical protein
MMPKKTTLLIIILAVVTAILVYLAVISDKAQEIINTTPLTPTAQNTAPTIAPYANLSFSVPSLDLSKTNTATQSVNIILNSNGKDVFGTQVELKYDPTVIYNVSISKPQESFFGQDAPVLINSVDPTEGRVSYATAFSANSSGKSGTGVVATLTFTANKYTGISSTSIAFLPKTTVTTLQSSQSVLKQTTPLSITLARPIVATQAPTQTP